MSVRKVYLPGLNGIRAIAALLVVIPHFTTFVSKYVSLTFTINDKTASIGGLAVTLFFVLSGYLITYLLIIEKERFNTVNLKLFYVRRILRIWPLYYLIIVCSLTITYFLSHNIIPRTSIFLYVIFCGNFVHAFKNSSGEAFDFLSMISVLWSLGVEEQFYLFWPLIIKKSNNIARAVITFFVVYAIAKIIIRIFFVDTFLSTLINLTRLDCMAIGAIVAVLVLDSKYYKSVVKRFIFNKYLQILSWLVFGVGFIFLPVPFSIFSDDVYAVFFIIIIINVSHNPLSIIKLESRVFNFLGKISYGIYMYHVVIMLILERIIPPIKDSIFNYFLYLSIVTVTTVITAYLSNRYIEAYFLKKKSLFSKLN